VPDGPPTTITAKTPKEAQKFIRDHNGQRNIHFSVNPTRTPIIDKAAKTDIAAIEFVFADLDPAEGESPSDAKARYLTQLETFKPAPDVRHRLRQRNSPAVAVGCADRSRRAGAGPPGEVKLLTQGASENRRCRSAQCSRHGEAQRQGGHTKYRSDFKAPGHDQ